jgi:hypothetical protein
MSEKLTVAKAERMQNTIDRQRNKLQEGARLGTGAFITGVGGGVAAGWLQAKYPTIGNTSISSSGGVGMVLVFGALSGVLDDYSDELCALGAGMLAASISREAEQYFAAA